jgi:hypothetical protein
LTWTPPSQTQLFHFVRKGSRDVGHPSALIKVSRALSGIALMFSRTMALPSAVRGGAEVDDFVPGGH